MYNPRDGPYQIVGGAQASSDSISLDSLMQDDTTAQVNNHSQKAIPISPVSPHGEPPRHVEPLQMAPGAQPNQSGSVRDSSNSHFSPNPSHSLGQASHSPPPSETKPTRSPLSFWQRFLSFWMYGWTAEVLGCVLAILSLVAIIIILILQGGRPLPDWPLGITTNALVAVFGVLLKAGMMIPLSEGISQLKWQWYTGTPRALIDIEEFDAASRGPWGSFMFLFRKGSHLLNLLAKVSAAVTVLAFALDPFTQQIVQTAPCQRQSANLTGTVSRTNNYIAHGGHVGGIMPEIDADIAVAITMGLVSPPPDPGATSLVSWQCSTGNCTFHDFTTVALCHSCQDITRSIRNTAGPDETANYTIPAEDGFPAVWVGQALALNARAAQSDSNTLDVKVVGWPMRGEKTYRPNADPVAVACQLRPCLRSLRARVEDMTLVEEEMGRRPMGVNQLYDTDRDSEVSGSPWFKFVDTSVEGCSTPAPANSSTSSSGGLIEVAIANVDAAPDEYPSRQQQQQQNGAAVTQTQWYPPHCVWSFGSGSHRSMRFELQWQVDNLKVWFAIGAPEASSVVARQLFAGGEFDFASVDAWAGSLSDVVTATMRRTGGEGFDSAAESAAGPASVPLTCLVVEWAWLSYPAALVVLTSLWLVVMVWQSPRREVTARGWKSSSLAVLFTNVDENKLQASTGKSGQQSVEVFDLSRSQLEDFAAVTHAQLIRCADGCPKMA